MNRGLYIHVPFCVRKCPYCDFYSIADTFLKAAYEGALVKEMQMRSSGMQEAVFDSVYLGGGTPTVLEPAETARILEAAHRHFPILQDCEITIEANPGTVNPKILAELRAAGINRINIGVQSFNDACLSFLGRIHSAKQAAEALDASEKAGFENIGLDLIYGLPGQNRGSWRKDLAAAASFSPSHVSCYMLTPEPGTEFADCLDKGRFSLPPEERVSEMFVQASKFLASRGYKHYEISNFASSWNTRSRHNLKYWNNAPYTGLGPSAHSYEEPVRSWNLPDINDYIRRLDSGSRPPGGSENLNCSQMITEAVYLGLRQAGGIDISAFERRFMIDFAGTFAPAAQRFADSGHMVLTDDSCRLTLGGMIILDTIAAHMAELA